MTTELHALITKIKHARAAIIEADVEIEQSTRNSNRYKAALKRKEKYTKLIPKLEKKLKSVQRETSA